MDELCILSQNYKDRYRLAGK